MSSKEASNKIELTRTNATALFCLNLGPFGPLGPLQDREGVIGRIPRPNKGGRSTGEKVAKLVEITPHLPLC